MGAQYILRFDDICPTMNWAVWQSLEMILTTYKISPILTVVPDNRDPNLMVHSEEPNFWARVRDWQKAGYFIALHGYQHLYRTPNAGLIGLNRRSEFAGLPFEDQKKMLMKAVEIFHDNGVRVDGWAAPAHSFDENTVDILRELGITVISDGFFLYPVKNMGVLWIPQQLWRLRRMPFGIWTVCYHHNHFSEQMIHEFEQEVAKYASHIVSPHQIINEYRVKAKDIGYFDKIFHRLWLASIRVRSMITRA